ncbi:hypothetical protein QR680_009672 [Steinernema hermaphroditum]|uniref:Asparagine synthetase [glutamine-hydrolyzing] n=1 Tax=Steinernema hermaphroditum TaxID=289476 RepID=A0AA39IL75_9BILA|nr:hypothetical protein QR680_009672 [Steinernema hermaphroditum]
MCGIFAVCHPAVCGKRPEAFSIQKAQLLSSTQVHRGPDCHNSYQNPVTGDLLCHERLAIMDLTCTQPIPGTQADHQVVHNGEIYNHEVLRKTELADFVLRTHCDSEVIVFLYEKERSGAICSHLDGVFAFALVFGDEFLAARDPIGVKPLYYGKDEKGRVFFASEMKAIESICGPHEMAAFPPGHFYQPDKGFVRYYQPLWFDHRFCKNPLNLAAVRNGLVTATHKRLMSDVPIGVLLSGGLDSSLVSSIAVREMKRLGLPLKSFSIGLDANAPDLVAARQVAAFLGTDHHEFHFTIEQGVENLKKLIWHLETYDVTSIRASTPMFFLSKGIAELGVKVVLSGEGADEIFGGYLYFHNAPNAEEFQKETIRRVQLLSTADCLRADKSCMANSVESRVPFLDKGFLDVAMMLEPSVKQPKLRNGRATEKWILRAAFDTEEDPYLPHDILWRQKEQFSDGVGYNWIDTLMEHCASRVSDAEMASAAERFPHNTPHSKEAFFMRSIFESHFGSDAAAKTVLKWIPKWQRNEDPSGRASAAHEQTIAAKEIVSA